MRTACPSAGSVTPSVIIRSIRIGADHVFPLSVERMTVAVKPRLAEVVALDGDGPVRRDPGRGEKARFDNPATTPPLTTDTWLLRSTNGGTSWTEERIGATSFDMTTAPDALGYFVGDYAGLDFAGGGLRPGFKPFQVRADSGNLMNCTDVFTTTASVAGP